MYDTPKSKSAANRAIELGLRYARVNPSLIEVLPNFRHTFYWETKPHLVNGKWINFVRWNELEYAE